MSSIDERGLVSTRIFNLKPWHEHLVLHVIKNPNLTSQELAEISGHPEKYVRRVVASPVFKKAVYDGWIDMLSNGQKRDLRHKLKSLMIQSIDTLSRRLDEADSKEVAAEALRVASYALQRFDRL
jgi:hypothetical protein